MPRFCDHVCARQPNWSFLTSSHVPFGYRFRRPSWPWKPARLQCAHHRRDPMTHCRCRCVVDSNPKTEPPQRPSRHHPAYARLHPEQQNFFTFLFFESCLWCFSWRIHRGKLMSFVQKKFSLPFCSCHPPPHCQTRITLTSDSGVVRDADAADAVVGFCCHFPGTAGAVSAKKTDSNLSRSIHTPRQRPERESSFFRPHVFARKGAQVSHTAIFVVAILVTTIHHHCCCPGHPQTPTPIQKCGRSASMLVQHLCLSSNKFIPSLPSVEIISDVQCVFACTHLPVFVGEVVSRLRIRIVSVHIKTRLRILQRKMKEMSCIATKTNMTDVRIQRPGFLFVCLFLFCFLFFYFFILTSEPEANGTRFEGFCCNFSSCTKLKDEKTLQSTL